MNCYVCTRFATVRLSVGVCLHCGAALCDEHFRQAHAFTVGGTAAYRCPHGVESSGAAEPAGIRQSHSR
jgi:hypothetical protein